MSVVGHQPPPFFKRGPAPLARLVFFVLVSLALLVLDLKYHYLEMTRQAVAVVTYPLQRIAAAPVGLYQELAGYLAGLDALKSENEQLRKKELEAANWLLRQQHLELENRRLRELLDAQARQPVTGRLAQILHASLDPFSRRVIVDKGSQDGIVAGQPVADEAGVLGQVTRVFPLQSEVTLVTDKNQAVPVKLLRNGLRAVLFGTSGGRLELRYLAVNADVEINDEIVTSGLDGIYPAGLPVARVSEIDRDNSYSFARILCDPVAGVGQHAHVLIFDVAAQPTAPSAEATGAPATAEPEPATAGAAPPPTAATAPNR